MFEPNINIIIDSNRNAFVFRLADEGEIFYTVFDSSLKSLGSKNLYDKNILKYSTFIDENNIIHLVALISSGELIYYKYTEEKWSKSTIAKFDMRANIYNQIEILVIKGNLHIIYNYSNLINSNIWTIQHIIYGNEEKHNTIRYISKKIPDPFIVDVDNQGTIHLLYKNSITDPQVYHSFYSPYAKSWSSISKQISSNSSNSFLPFLFIDSQDNLHGLWLEELNNKYQPKYLRMSSSGKEKYIWKDTNLPYIQSSKYPPIIFEENNKLKLVFLSNDNISFFHSSDYGISWSNAKTNENINQNIVLAKINSSTNRMNYIYCNFFDNPRFYFLDSLVYKEPENTYEEILIKSHINEVVPDIIEVNSSNLNDLNDKIDEILNNFHSQQSILTQILDNQKYIENKLESIQDSIDLKKSSIFDRFFN